MRGLGYAAAIGALLISASAQAQIIDADGTNLAGGHLVQDTLSVPVKPPTGYWSGAGEGASVEAIISITSNQVSFESGVAVSGGWARATSFSGVDVTVSNNTDGLIEINNFGSTIIPAGMGFYLQDRQGAAEENNIFTGYGQTVENLGFDDLEMSADNYSDIYLSNAGDTIAYSDFTFDIYNGEALLYTLSGSMSLTLDYYGNLERHFNLGAAAETLDGFTTAFDNDYAWAYAWDSTHIEVPLYALLETGQSTTLQYRTTVTSYTRADCITGITCLVAYSGFGDPIGRGGGANLLMAENDMGLFGFEAQAENPCAPRLNQAAIESIRFCPASFTPFEFLDNNGGGTVPEPATWAIMIMGFGFMGAALRRRRVPSYS